MVREEAELFQGQVVRHEVSQDSSEDTQEN